MVWTPVAVFIAQFLMAMFLGILIPLFIAFQSWKKVHPPKIPFTQSLGLAMLSLFLMFIFPLPVIGMGIAYLGNNHSASIGTTVGWALGAIIYWPLMKWLFAYTKKRHKKRS